MKARVSEINGLPTLVVDDKPIAPMLFFANTEIGKNDICEREVRLAASYGVHLYSVCCHLPVWKKRGERSFDNALEALRLTVRNDPGAMILLRMNISIYGNTALEWDKEHPGDSMLFAYEIPGFEDGTNLNYGNTAVTLASDAWLEAAMDTLQEFTDLVYAQPDLNNALIGYHIAAGESGEWFHCSLRERGIDLSETNRKKYCSYLKEKYQTIEALCSAWEVSDKAYASFDEIIVPFDIEGNNRATPASRTLFTRKGDMRFIDYSDYSSEIVADRIVKLADFTKKITNHEKLVVFFYGYYYDLYDARTGHFRVEKLFGCESIDAFSSPICYTDRNNGGVGALMSPADSFIRAGKLWLVENDLRTCLCLRDEGLYDWVPKVPSIENLFEVYKREFAQMAAHGLGCWYMDLMARGWQYHPDIWACISDLQGRYYGLLEKCGRFIPDVAVITDEKAMSVCAHAEAIGMNILYSQRLEFYRAGLKFGLYTSGDYEQSDLKTKLVIYLNPFDISDERAAAIKTKLAGDGSSVLFLHGFGRTSAGAARLLTGFDIDVHDLYMTELTSIPCDGFKVSGEKILQDTMTDGERPRGRQFSNPVYVPQESEDVKVLARFAAGSHKGKASLVYKEAADRKTFFASGMTLTAGALREIARICGVHIYYEGEDTCIVGGDMVTIHTRTGGAKKILFPSAGTYREIYSDLVYETAGEIDIYAENYKTYTYIKEK